MVIINHPLRVVVVHHSPVIARSILRDLTKIGTATSETHKTSCIHEAREVIDEMEPHIVFVAINLPHGKAFDLLQDFPPSKRTFALIIVDEPLKLVAMPEAEQQGRFQHVLENQAVAYLMVGVFHNGTLATSIERARTRLQEVILERQQGEVNDYLVRFVTDGAEEWRETMARIHNVSKTVGVSVGTSASRQALKKGTGHSEQAHTPVLRIKSLHNRHHGNAPSKKHLRISELCWSRLIRLQAQENYYGLWYFDEEGIVQMELIRKGEVLLSERPSFMFKANKSEYINVHWIADIGAKAVMMMCGGFVRLAERQQQTFQEIFRAVSSQLAALDELQAVLTRYEARQKKKLKLKLKAESKTKSKAKRKLHSK
jgi:hypothetical protein